MAVRENQGLQIALIIFALLMIVTGVCAFMFFRWYEEALLASKASLDEKGKAVASQRAAEVEASALKKIYGGSETDSVDTIQKNFADDMKNYGGNFKESDQHYRQLVKYLHTELLAAQSRFVDDKLREEELKAKIAADEKIKAAELAKYKENLDKSAADLKAELASFNEVREEIEKSKTDIAKQIDTTCKGADDRTKKADDELKGKDSQIERLAKQIEILKNKHEKTETTLDLPRGRITWVDQRDHVVWINVGAADGLRRQVTFKVLGPNEPSLVEAKSKASIEVVRLLDAHLAEARIVSDKLDDPIMPGDQIFSQVWAAGRVEHFALDGFMDIDGNGESDRALVKNLIANNGGVIDAEVTDAGKREGDLSFNTSYLIMGARPGDKGVSAEFLKSYSEMINESKSFGIQTIRLEDFLNNIGYVPEEHAVAMDKNAESGDFKAKPRDGVLRKSNAQFAPRKPHPVQTRPSAYSSAIA